MLALQHRLTVLAVLTLRITRPVLPSEVSSMDVNSGSGGNGSQEQLQTKEAECAAVSRPVLSSEPFAFHILPAAGLRDSETVRKNPETCRHESDIIIRFPVSFSRHHDPPLALSLPSFPLAWHTRT